MIGIKSIPQCDHRVKEFNCDLWEGMIQRIRQMVITNSSENKINWNVKIENPNPAHRYNKSIANMVFLRGDKIFEERKSFEDEYFSLP